MEKLSEVGGPDIAEVEFHSWVWASGKHGGLRLLHTGAGTVHILFLQEQSGYLRTVCDYPAYDLDIEANAAPAFLAN